MPIVAIGIAGIAWAGAAGAVGGLIAGAGLTLAGAFAITAAVGATLSAIGSITGDEDLSMVGTVLGAVGGIGSLATSAGLFGADAGSAQLFGVDAAEGVQAADIASSATGGDLSKLGQLPDAGSGMINNAEMGGQFVDSASATGMEGGIVEADIIDSFTGKAVEGFGQVKDAIKPEAVIEAASEPVKGVSATAKTGLINGKVATGLDMEGPMTAAPSSDALAAPVTGAPKAPDIADLAKGATSFAADGRPDASIPGNVFTGKDGVKYVSNGRGGWVAEKTGGFMDFLSSEGGGMVAMGAMQAGGAFLQGATDTLKPAQVAAYEAQAAANQAAANLANRKNENMGGAIPVATRGPRPLVTGQPQPVLGGGLINRPAPVGAMP